MNTYKSDYIFINCPFDDEYIPLLFPLLFTIIYLGKEPLISETQDSGENRFEQIIKLMKKANYSIHDLSRIDSNPPRFNMPLELGFDLCLKRSKQYSKKVILILEGEQYSLKSIMSDLAGNDTKHHNNSPEEIVKCVRNWFFTTIEKIDIKYNEIINNYLSFIEVFINDLKISSVKEIKDISFSEIIYNMQKWIEKLINK